MDEAKHGSEVLPTSRRERRFSTSSQYHLYGPTTSLIEPHDDSGEGEDELAEDDKGCCKGKLFPAGFKQEFVASTKILWGMVVIFICNVSMQPVAVMFGGHLGALELDAVSLAGMLINVFGNSVCIGLATACDTLFAQTYGSGNMYMLSVQLQTSILIIGVCALLLCLALHLNIETLLVLLGQDPMVAALTGEYCLYFLPGMVFLFASILVNRYLSCQDIVTPQVLIYLFGIGLHAVFQYVFLYVLELGIPGSAIAQSIAYFNNFVGVLIYSFYVGVFKDTWKGWSWQCLEGWGEFTKLAVSGMLMVCLEWWAFEILIIIAGLLGTVELGAQGVLFNWNALLFAIPGGIGMSAAIRIGQELGADRPLHAKTAFQVNFVITLVVTSIFFVIIILLKDYLPLAFTTDPEIVELTAKIFPLLAIFKLTDDFTMVARFSIRGMGKQMFGTVVIFVSYYFIGLPAGISMMFLTPLKSGALWLGNTIAMVVCLVIYMIYLFHYISWEQVAREARVRAGVEQARTPKEAVVDTRGENSARNSYAEKTPLLSENHTNYSGTDEGKSGGVASKPTPALERYISMTEADAEAQFKDRSYLMRLLLKRVLTIILFIAIFVAGVLCRIFIDINEISPIINVNSTSPQEVLFTTVSL